MLSSAFQPLWAVGTIAILLLHQVPVLHLRQTKRQLPQQVRLVLNQGASDVPKLFHLRLVFYLVQKIVQEFKVD